MAGRRFVVWKARNRVCPRSDALFNAFGVSSRLKAEAMTNDSHRNNPGCQRINNPADIDKWIALAAQMRMEHLTELLRPARAGLLDLAMPRRGDCVPPQGLTSARPTLIVFSDRDSTGPADWAAWPVTAC